MAALAPLSDLIPAATSLTQGLTDIYASFSGTVSGLTHSFTAWYSQAGHAIAEVVTNFSSAMGSAVLWQSVLYWALLVVMLVGIIGAFVPALPGIILIVAAVVIWGLVKGFAGLWVALGVAIAAFLLGIAIDYLSGIIGAQRVGASNWAQVGAVVGMFLGVFGLLPALPIGGPLLGLIFGTVLGAFVGEFLHRRNLPLPQRVQQSFKVGIAIVVGNLVGTLLQGLLAIVAVIVFIVTTWPSLYSVGG
ncbi:MAG TPA: DUF456 family protein [Leptolyngbyaceae cyanobacterium]